MSGGKVIGLVMGRELRDRLGNKGFVLTTVVMLVVLAAIIIVPSLFSDDGPSEYEVGLLAGAELPEGLAPVLTATGAAADAQVTVETVADRAAAEAAVTEGTLDVVVLDATTLLADGLDIGLRAIVEQSLAAAGLYDALTQSGIDPTEVDRLLGGAPVSVVSPTGQDEEDTGSSFAMAFIVTVLLFLILQFNGASLLTTTVEEKSSRVVEVLLGTIRPWQLLAGKLSAMTVLSMAQLALYAAVAYAAVSLVDGFDIPPASPMVIITALVMFPLGFGLWAAIYAVAGALSTSAEEAQAAAGPIGFLGAAVYMGVIIWVVPNPDGTVAQVLSYLPFSAPFAIPARAAFGLPVWQFAVAAALTGLGSFLVVRLAGRLYSAAVLAGGKLTWRGALKAEPIR